MSLLKCALDLAAGTLSSKSLVERAVTLCSRQTSQMNLEIDPGECFEAASNTDAARRMGDSALSVISGIPISVKDNFMVKNCVTSAGSQILSNFSSPFDATPVNDLRKNGAIIYPRANMDEFGMGSSMLNSSRGYCVNPWTENGSPPLSPGGSSGGSASMVAQGVFCAALASDTGGSVRQPASFCGVVGFKPSYGRVSRHGLVSYVSSMDTPSIISQTVADSAIIFDAISTQDSKDCTSLRSPSAKVTPALLGSAATAWTGQQDSAVTPERIAAMMVRAQSPVSLKGLVVGIPAEWVLSEVGEEVRRVWSDAITMLEDAGASVKTVSIPALKVALPCYYLLACAEASSNLARYDGIRFGARSVAAPGGEEAAGAAKGTDSRSTTEGLFAMIAKSRGEGFGKEVIKRVLAGTFVLSKSAFDEYYVTADRIRAKLRRDMHQVLRGGDGGVDCLLGPTSPHSAFLLHSPPDAAEMMINDCLTVPANLCGLPAISVPCGVATQNFPARVSGVQEDQGVQNGPSLTRAAHTATVPVGMQLVGRYCMEGDLFRVALALEQRANFVAHVPEWVRLA